MSPNKQFNNPRQAGRPEHQRNQGGNQFGGRSGGPQNNDGELKEITAPYNFVPLSNTVVFPEWADAVLHDIPFEDGISGTITCELTTVSPVYVRNGGNWVKNGKRNDILEKPEAQSFFKVGEEYLIPGTSLKGMIRNVVEIASFGKMNKTDDKRYSLRDLTGGVSKIYASNMTITRDEQKKIYEPRVQAGWLEIDSNGKWLITSSDYARVDQNDLIAYHGGSPDLKKKQTAHEKYRQWNKHGKSLSIDFNLGSMPADGWRHSCGFLIYKKAIDLKAGKTGTIVFTGQPSSNDASVQLDGVALGQLPLPKNRIEHNEYKKLLIFKGVMQNDEKVRLLRHSEDSGYQTAIRQLYDDSRGKHKDKTKHMEFVFFNSGKIFEIPETIRREFLFIHSPAGNDNEEWKECRILLRDRKPVPVFYLEKEGVFHSFGLAQMFKLPYACSVHDLLRHTSASHTTSDRPDFAETVMGYSDIKKSDSNGAEKTISLRGRISISHAVANPQPKSAGVSPPTVLGAPKPTYFPAYIRQPAGKFSEYRTMMNDGTERADGTVSDKAEVSGWKRYPARAGDIVKPVKDLPPPPRRNDGSINMDVATKFEPLAGGAKFKFTIHVHNLLTVELGALIWALTWGGNETLVHSLGMGKSFGYGQVKISICSHSLMQFGGMDRREYKLNCRSLMDEFDCYMATHMPKPQQGKPTQKKEERSGFGVLAALKNSMSAGASSWLASEQMKQLLAMADPLHQPTGSTQDKKLKHMTLKPKNQFVEAKNKNRMLRLEPHL